MISRTVFSYGNTFISIFNMPCSLLMEGCEDAEDPEKGSHEELS